MSNEKYKVLLCLSAGVLVGVFLGSAISSQNLSFKFLQSGVFWSAAGAVGSFLAAFSAVWIAVKSWKNTEKSKVESYLRNQLVCALQAKMHFVSVSRVAAVLAIDTNNEIFRSKGGVQDKIEMISGIWNMALKNKDMAMTLNYIYEWEEIDLILEFDTKILTLLNMVNFLGNDKFLSADYDSYFLALKDILELCAVLAVEYEMNVKSDLDNHLNKDKYNKIDAHFLVDSAGFMVIRERLKKHLKDIMLTEK